MTLSPQPRTAHETSNPYPVSADKMAGSFKTGTALGISLLSSSQLPSPAHPHWSVVGLLHQALLSLQRLGRGGMGRNCPGAVGSFHSVCPLRFPLSMGVAGWRYHPLPLKISQSAFAYGSQTQMPFPSVTGESLQWRVGRGSKGCPGELCPCGKASSAQSAERSRDVREDWLP